jgi:hypothetical protein
MKKALILLTLLNITIFSFGQSPATLPDSVEIGDDYSPLRKEAFHASEIIYRVPKNQKFALIRVNYDGYFEVRNESFSRAFIFYPFVKNGKVIFEASQKPKLSLDEEAEIRRNDSIADILNRKAKEEGKAYFESLRVKAQQDINKRRPVYVKKYGPVNGEKVAKGLIWIGMTEQMLIDSWGQPEDINASVTRYGSRKQYVYGSGQYVYVENGIVDSWQN